MKKILAITLAVAAMGIAGAASAQDAAQKAGCNTCHALDAKKLGPSYKSIAAKYQGKAEADKELVAKLTSAKGHPAVKAPAADVEAAVKWLLAQQ